MQPKPVRLTDSRARELPAPETGYRLYWCPVTQGLGVRVTANGARAWILERRVDGDTVRRTLGKVTGRGSIGADAARKLCIEVSSELQQGVDRMAVKVAERKARKVEDAEDALTLSVAVSDYVKGKRRGKDGKPLKDRTKADYLAMVEGGRTTKDGRPLLDGELYALASMPIAKISADDVRSVYESTLKRSQRQATYAMQVLRAVLNWHGVKVPGNPLSKDTAGRDRIVLPQTAGAPKPIPPEKLGAWWRAALNAGKGSGHIGGSAATADACRFLLLTGCRPGEVFGSAHVPARKVRDLDIEGARLTLPDTKNRRDHVVMLSRQALAIAAKHAEGKKPTAPLFDVQDPGKTLAAIGADAGVEGVTAHKLRHTFASIAEELVSAGALKAMLNHTASGDVTHTHYIGKSETQLRTAWQAVADFIEGAA